MQQQQHRTGSSSARPRVCKVQRVPMQETLSPIIQSDAHTAFHPYSLSSPMQQQVTICIAGREREREREKERGHGMAEEEEIKHHPFLYFLQRCTTPPPSVHAPSFSRLHPGTAHAHCRNVQFSKGFTVLEKVYLFSTFLEPQYINFLHAVLWFLQTN